MSSDLDLDQRLDRLAPAVDVDAALAAIGARPVPTRRRHRVVLAAAVCALLALAGAVALAARGPSGREVATQGPSRPDDVVPFEREPVPSTADLDTYATPDDPDCTPDMVTFSVRPPVVAGPYPDGQRIVELRARPGERCAIPSWPPLTLTIGAGSPERIDIDPGSPGRRLLAGRVRLIGTFNWRSSCGARDAPRQIAAELPGGGTVAAPVPDPPPCLLTRPETDGSWEIDLPSPTPSALEASLIDVPEVAPADGTLRAIVELTNPGTEPVALDPCPSYTLSYGDGAASGTAIDNRFNCAEAPAAIGPGERLRFAVELPVRGDAGFTGEVGLVVHFAGGVTAEAVPVPLRTEG